MNKQLSISPVDPHDDCVATLIRELAQEEAIRYADLGPDTLDSFSPHDVLSGRGLCVIARLDGKPVGCGALRPIGLDVGEVKRMYVVPAARRQGIARAILYVLEMRAREFGYRVLRAETGNRQPEAIALYAQFGFYRTAPFGSHAEDPVSVFFEKLLSTSGRSRLKLAIPVLHVSSSAAAEQFYCTGLGFQRTFAYRPDESRTDPCYLVLMRDGVVLHVSSFPGDGVAGGVVTFIVTDVDALHAEFVQNGVRIELEPTDQTWGNREMYVEDTDGNSVRFVQRGGN